MNSATPKMRCSVHDAHIIYVYIRIYNPAYNLSTRLLSELYLAWHNGTNAISIAQMKVVKAEEVDKPDGCNGKSPYL